MKKNVGKISSGKHDNSVYVVLVNDYKRQSCRKFPGKFNSIAPNVYVVAIST